MELSLLASGPGCQKFDWQKGGIFDRINTINRIEAQQAQVFGAIGFLMREDVGEGCFLIALHYDKSHPQPGGEHQID
jgi:hypothetical protein